MIHKRKSEKKNQSNKKGALKRGNTPIGEKKQDGFRLPKVKNLESSWPMRLNKYVAHCGVASRREAMELIKHGYVSVNGQVVYEPGTPVNEDDRVLFKGKWIKPETKRVYLLLNKPKNFITTLSDEKGRKTIMDLLPPEIDQRVFPVGRLDRNTTGLILVTNDGELANKLSHPASEVSKVYKVTLDRAFSESDMAKLRAGLTLDDGWIKPDSVNYMANEDANIVAVGLHSGKNRIVRRMFEHLGYVVKYLDRTHYAGLSKKDLPRGRYRHLTDREIIMLRHFIKGPKI